VIDLLRHEPRQIDNQIPVAVDLGEKSLSSFVKNRDRGAPSRGVDKPSAQMIIPAPDGLESTRSSEWGPTHEVDAMAPAVRHPPNSWHEVRANR
jgi:hypothetical protein